MNYRGAKRQDVIGRRARDLLSPGVFENEVKPKLDECFRGNAVQFEMRYCYPHLGERELPVKYFPVTGRGGVDRVATVLQDITDQRESEHSLRLFRALIDQSNDAVEVVDAETLRFLDVNETGCRQLGYTREELLLMRVPEGLLCVVTRAGERRIGNTATPRRKRKCDAAKNDFVLR